MDFGGEPSERLIILGWVSALLKALTKNHNNNAKNSRVKNRALDLALKA
jgi:hypothetical protein